VALAVALAATVGLAAACGDDDPAADREATTTSSIRAATPTSADRARPTSTTPAATTTPTGAFSVAPGASPRVGTGPLRTYAVEVEHGTGIAPADFAVEVDRILGAARGWTADGSVAFQRTAGGPVDLRVVLATPETTDELCAPIRTNGIYSCRNGGRAVINLMRWTEGSPESRLALDEYRIYVISHEVGHAIGHDHVGCPAAGAPAPVMMQQTKGIGACAPNPWPFP
jgi:hypothetical protein